MKTTIMFAAQFAVSLGLSSLAMAHGGGGGSGAHFSGGGTHFGSGGNFTRASAVRAGRPFSGMQNRGVVPGGPRRGDRPFEGQHRSFDLGGWSYLNDGMGESYAVAATPDDNEGDATVAAVQEALAREGYYRSAVDGNLDLITQDAIERYERDHGVPVTGTIGDALLRSLQLE